MKKALLIMASVLLVLALSSCTPSNVEVKPSGQEAGSCEDNEQQHSKSDEEEQFDETEQE